MMPYFLELVGYELARARHKHGPIKSPWEAYAVILEELDEAWAEVKAQSLDRRRLLHELVQTAAMCQRAAEDLQLMEDI